jgi:Domain of unknown function (DUF4145)
MQELAETAEQCYQDDILLMVCPFCQHDIAASWQTLVSITDELGRHRQGVHSHLHSEIPAKDPKCITAVSVVVEWLFCQNHECRQIIIQITRTEDYPHDKNRTPTTDLWIALPKRKGIPAIDVLVTGPMRRDYLEAFTILDDSPRMSSVLSRRILADLLKKYAAATQFGLAARIDAFVKDTKHPSRLRDNLHYLREIANFSAHTQTTVEEEVIEVTPEEAQWTLKIVADLFDYFIVAPKRDEVLRTSFDKKLEAAGRKRIPKPVEDDNNDTQK